MNPPENQREVEVSEEAVELAYRSLDGEQLKWLASAPPDRKAIVSKALQAAAPVLCAQEREKLLGEINQLRDDLDEARDARFEEGCDECENRREAERLRADKAEAERDQAAQQERERLEPVVAAARRVLRMHYGDQSPSNPAAHALYSALADLDAPAKENEND